MLAERLTRSYSSQEKWSEDLIKILSHALFTHDATFCSSISTSVWNHLRWQSGAESLSYWPGWSWTCDALRGIFNTLDALILGMTDYYELESALRHRRIEDENRSNETRFYPDVGRQHKSAFLLWRTLFHSFVPPSQQGHFSRSAEHFLPHWSSYHLQPCTRCIEFGSDITQRWSRFTVISLDMSNYHTLVLGIRCPKEEGLSMALMRTKEMQ